MRILEKPIFALASLFFKGQHEKKIHPVMALKQDEDMANSNSNSNTLPTRPAVTPTTGQSKASDKQDAKMTSDEPSESHSDSDDNESSSEAESSSDHDSTSEEEDNNNDIPTLKPGVKPDFSSARKLTAGAPSLQDRLKSFLPQLAEANSKLAKDGTNAFSMEDVGEDEPHIEMDLGLGVLEEKREGESEDEDEGNGEMEGEERERKTKEKDVMSELMGRKGEDNLTKGIEEVG